MLPSLHDRYLGAARNRPSQPTPLAVCYKNAWAKLTKYYNLTDSSHSIYAAAVLFNPAHRKTYFDERWVSDVMLQWKEVMIATVRKTWEDEYRTELAIPEPEFEHRNNFLTDYLTRIPRAQAISNNPFTSYISDAPVQWPREGQESNKDLISWWMRPNNPYKALRQQALDLLSIPAMSAEVKRVFSTAKRLVTVDRNRLDEESIETLSLLRY